MMPRTPSKRGIVFGLHQGGLTGYQIAKKLLRPPASVYSILSRCQLPSSLRNHPRSGRNRITTNRDERHIIRDIALHN